MRFAGFRYAPVIGLMVLTSCAGLPTKSDIQNNLLGGDYETTEDNDRGSENVRIIKKPIEPVSEPVFPRTVASATIPWWVTASCRSDPAYKMKSRQDFLKRCKEIVDSIRGQEPELSPRDDPRHFMALSISGGGQKAAIFGAEVMFYLDAMGLLEQTDVISAVSGGGYAAALYAASADATDAAAVRGISLDGPKPDRKEVADCLENARGHADEWLRRLSCHRLRPPVWDYREVSAALDQGFLGAGYQVLAVSTINANVPGPWVPFSSNRTFADSIENGMLGITGRGFKIGDLNPSRPVLHLNTTNLSTSRIDLEGRLGSYAIRERWSRLARVGKHLEEGQPTGQPFLRNRDTEERYHFSLTDYYFDLIGSDINQFPLPTAVTAAGAFPILIDNVPIWDYCHNPAAVDNISLNKNLCLLTKEDVENIETNLPLRRKEPKDYEEIYKGSIFLMDGGANDNQAMQGIYFTLKELFHNERRSLAFDYKHTPWKTGKSPDSVVWFIINSSITEVSGIDPESGEGSSAFDSIPGLSKGALGLFRTLTRSLRSIDTYSATGYRLRKRLYEKELICKTIDRETGRIHEKICPLNSAGMPVTERGVPFAMSEIGLTQLDQYGYGGIDGYAYSASVEQENRIQELARSVPRLAMAMQPPAARDEEPSTGDPWSISISQRIERQRNALSALWDHSSKDTRRRLGLGAYHPQCYFNALRTLEDGITSLANIDAKKRTCLRRAARWSVMLRATELCLEQESAEGRSDATKLLGGALACEKAETTENETPLYVPVFKNEDKVGGIPGAIGDQDIDECALVRTPDAGAEDFGPSDDYLVIPVDPEQIRPIWDPRWKQAERLSVDGDRSLIYFPKTGTDTGPRKPVFIPTDQRVCPMAS